MMYGRCGVVICVCGLVLATGCGTVHRVATRDGLVLAVDSAGAIVRCEIDGREVLRRGQHGGIFVADVGAPPGPDRELLTNPGLERLEEGRPVGWLVGPEWSVDREVSHSGNTSMRVHIPGAEKRSTQDLAQEVSVKPNTSYRVSMWVRFGGGIANLYVQQFDEDGHMHPDYPQLTVSHSHRQPDWFQLTRSFTTGFFCRKIRVRTNLWQQTGTAWIDDVSLVCLDDDCLSPQRRVRSTVAPTAAGLEQRGELGGESLSVKTTYTACDDLIVVDGEIEDTSGRDRAVTVSFRLPINGAGWTWYEDLHNRQPIEKDVRYGGARLMGGDGRRTVALYPFAALGDSRSALALAVPMDMPRAFRLCFDPELGYYVNYEFALTQATAKFPGRAWYRFFIYRIDPEWGFRSAADRYYASHPEFFTKRISSEDAIGSIRLVDEYTSPDYAFPGYADFGWHRRQSLPAYRREQCKALHYTEFIGWWGWAIGIKPEQAETQPTPEDALAHVRELAERETPHDVARCILNCIPYGRDGKPQLHRNYVPKWGGYNYLCNPDPEIRGLGGGEVNRFTLTCKREVAEMDRYELDGMRYDNPIVFAMDNYRREHFRWADHPLAFDHVSRKPVLPLDFSSFECAKAIADDMHSRGKIVGSNYTPVAYPSDIFQIQCLDIIGSETLWTWPTDVKLRLQRTLAHRKTVAMCWQEAKKDWARDRVESQLKHAMFYGTFYYFSTMGEDLYERWIPLTRRLAHAGWEPVTYACCEELEGMVERFGSRSQRNLHFTLRNKTEEPKTVTLKLDAEALDLNTAPQPRLWILRDADTFAQIDVTRCGTQWETELPLEPRDTTVVRIATPVGIALDHLFLVPERLQKAANYRMALLEVRSDLSCPDYEPLVQQAVDLIEALRGPQPDLPKIRQGVMHLSGTLAGPVTYSNAGEQAFLCARLHRHITAARRGFEQAIAVLE